MKSCITQIIYCYALLLSSFLMLGGILQFMVIDNVMKDAVISFEDKEEEKETNDLTVQETLKEQQKEGVIAILLLKDKKIPVYDGVNEKTLLYGAARNGNSAFPNTKGNSILFGHRDSVFHLLKDVEINDIFYIQTKDKKLTYKVIETQIVETNDVRVFKTSEKIMVSLVTCYPFSIYGPSPQRYLVRAEVLF